jgi:hypothetical protein
MVCFWYLHRSQTFIMVFVIFFTFLLTIVLYDNWNGYVLHYISVAISVLSVCILDIYSILVIGLLLSILSFKLWSIVIIWVYELLSLLCYYYVLLFKLFMSFNTLSMYLWIEIVNTMQICVFLIWGMSILLYYCFMLSMVNIFVLLINMYINYYWLFSVNDEYGSLFLLTYSFWLVLFIKCYIYPFTLFIICLYCSIHWILIYCISTYSISIFVLLLTEYYIVDLNYTVTVFIVFMYSFIYIIILLIDTPCIYILICSSYITSCFTIIVSLFYIKLGMFILIYYYYYLYYICFIAWLYYNISCHTDIYLNGCVYIIYMYILLILSGIPPSGLILVKCVSLYFIMHWWALGIYLCLFVVVLTIIFVLFIRMCFTNIRYYTIYLYSLFDTTLAYLWFSLSPYYNAYILIVNCMQTQQHPP